MGVGRGMSVLRDSTTHPGTINNRVNPVQMRYINSFGINLPFLRLPTNSGCSFSPLAFFCIHPFACSRNSALVSFVVLYLRPIVRLRSAGFLLYKDIFGVSFPPQSR